jgi:predicted nucleic acid-binding protein
VWSLALRRDAPLPVAEVQTLARALETGETVVTTGIVLQELLQGFTGPKARNHILERFSSLPLLLPDREDHIDAADLRNRCRRAGVQVGAVDTLLAELCIRHHLTMLSTDEDFKSMARHCSLRLWRP